LSLDGDRGQVRLDLAPDLNLLVPRQVATVDVSANRIDALLGITQPGLDDDWVPNAKLACDIGAVMTVKDIPVLVLDDREGMVKP